MPILDVTGTAGGKFNNGMCVLYITYRGQEVNDTHLYRQLTAHSKLTTCIPIS